MTRMLKNTNLVFAICMVMFLGLILSAGCISSNSSSNLPTYEKHILTTAKTLAAAKEFRTAGLNAAKEYWDKGLIDVKTKDKIVEVANNLQSAINTVADLLIIYKESKGESGYSDLEAKMAIYTAVYGQFSDLIMPYVIDKLGGTNNG